MRHPGQPADWRSTCDPHTLEAIQDLARQWLAKVAPANFIPGKTSRARAMLEDLLYRLVTALRAEEFQPHGGYLVGGDLVRARVSSPQALGLTLTLLNERLPVAFGDVG